MIEMWTTSWEGHRQEIQKLRYVEYRTDKPWGPVLRETVLLEVDITTASKWELSKFFKDVARMTKNYPEDDFVHAQFACTIENDDFPIKWFYIKHPKFVISHDMAFDTVILSKIFGQDHTAIHDHQHVIPLGRFFRKRQRSRWAYSKNKRDAYKCISNMILSF